MGKDKTTLGDRMKVYEGIEAGRILMPLAPVLARLDGRAFHTFTRGLDRPYDQRLMKLMVETTQYLIEQTEALMGYTQSDEITLVWQADDIKSQILFDGRIQKMTSILAAMATAKFNQRLPEYLPKKASSLPLFDCRVWSVPSREEAANAFLWRELDATRNSVQMAGHAHFSHKALQGKSNAEVQDMLFKEKGINWNDYPASFKRGTWLQKRRVTRPFTTEEIEKLPQKHEARRNPDLKVERWEIRELAMPPFSQVSNRAEVIFAGADPERYRSPDFTKGLDHLPDLPGRAG